MSLDFRAEFKTVYSYIEKRVADFDPSANSGPGEADEPIQQIDLGYQFDQAGWIAIVFDTRPDAESDGQWQLHIEDNMLELNHWCEAFDTLIENEVPITVTLRDGSVETLNPDMEMEDLAELFGVVLKDALLEARNAGVFATLPLAATCVMGIEEHEGNYGWPEYENRDEGRIEGPA